MRLSKNFTLAEFERSMYARRNGIDNSMNGAQIKAAKYLCETVLQPARDALGSIIITSGYRNEQVNRGVNGSKASDHKTGGAADIELLGGDNWELLEWIKKHCEYDQLIAEFMVKGDHDKGWVHVSTKQPNRNQFLTIG